MVAISTNHFTFNKSDRCFVAEASDLGTLFLIQEEITLVSSRTGDRKAFFHHDTYRDADQDVQFWSYLSDDGLSLHILND